MNPIRILMIKQGPAELKRHNELRKENFLFSHTYELRANLLVGMKAPLSRLQPSRAIHNNLPNLVRYLHIGLEQDQLDYFWGGKGGQWV